MNGKSGQNGKVSHCALSSLLPLHPTWQGQGSACSSKGKGRKPVLGRLWFGLRIAEWNALAALPFLKISLFVKWKYSNIHVSKVAYLLQTDSRCSGRCRILHFSAVCAFWGDRFAQCPQGHNTRFLSVLFGRENTVLKTSVYFSLRTLTPYMSVYCFNII